MAKEGTGQVAYVMVSVEGKQAHTIFKKLLKDTKTVKEVHPIFGEYDMIVKLECADFEDVGRYVVDVIRKIKGVTDTKTLTGIKF